MTKLLSSLLTEGGAPIAVQNEGVQVTASLFAIDFKNGLTATLNAGAVEVSADAPPSTTIIKATQVAHGFSLGDVVEYYAGAWHLVIGFRTISAGIVSATPTVDTLEVTTTGVVTGLTGIQEGQLYYADDLIGGQPLSTTDYPLLSVIDALIGGMQPVAYGLSPTSLLVFPSPAREHSPFVISSGATAGVMQLFYRNGDDQFDLALANSLTTLASGVSYATDSSGRCAVGPVPSHGMSLVSDVAYPLAYLCGVAAPKLTGSFGAKVYLSDTVPGGVTLTPPAIRQVVGRLDNYTNVVFFPPYLETAKITVGTTAPSSPAIGDLWVDTN